tara:strand:+ start:68 stop:934 length:867 start_codon:yes stop_codon:yes gene_type:complete
MSKGVIIFAHNNRQIDYIRMSILAAKLANKNLQVPVSLVTDPSTIDWMKESNIEKKVTQTFDKIIITQRPDDTSNIKNYNDGKDTVHAPFTNGNRCSVWDLTPYDRTLMIDSDYLTLTDILSTYWEVDSDLLISGNYNDIQGHERVGYLDTHISETGIEMLWATTVMFTKNETTKIFFDLVSHVKEKYKMYSDIYRFNPIIFRNDIAFSIAKHIMNGHQKINEPKLPDIFSTADKDILVDVSNKKLKFLVAQNNSDGYVATTITNKDVHVMNKFSIMRNYDDLMELAQ